MRKIFSLFLVLLFFTAGHASGIENFTSELGEPYLKARNLILNFHFKEAHELLKKGKNPVLNSYFATQVPAWNFVLTEDKSFLDDFNNLADKTIDLLNDQPESALNYYLKADLLIWRTIVRIRNEEIISGAWSGREAMLTYKKAAALAPGNADVMKGTGAFRYVAGAIPSGIEWLAGLFGLSGSLKAGYADLQHAALHGSLGAPEARLFLAAIELFSNREAKRSIAHLDTLLTSYPENGVFLLLKSVALLRDKRVSESISLMETHLPVFKNRMPAFAEVVRFRIAEGYHFLNQHDLAIQQLETFINGYKGRSLRRLALFRLGVSYEIKGNRSKAVDCFKKVDANENNDFDLYMRRLCERYVEKPMPESEKYLWLGRNYFDSGMNDLALINYNKADSLAGSNQLLKAELHFRYGRLWEVTGKNEKAFQSYQKAIKDCPESDLWIKAYAMYQIGRMKIAEGDITSGIAWFDKCLGLDDHLFERSLMREIDTEKKKLNGW